MRGVRRALSSVSLFLLRLRVQRLVALVLAGLVLMTAFIFAAIPRLYSAMSDDGLRYQMRISPPAVVNLAMLEQRAPALGGSEAVDVIQSEGQSFAETLPPALNRLIGDQQSVADSAEFDTTPLHGGPLDYPLYLKLRYQSGLEGRIVLSDGRLPAAGAEMVALPGWLPLPGLSLPDGRPAPVPLVEVAVSAETAASDRLTVGQRFLSHAVKRLAISRFDQPDPPGAGYAVVEIVGIFTVADAQDPFWYGDVNLQRPTITGSPDAQQVHATALTAPQGYAALAGQGLTFSYEWRYFFDPQRTDAGQLDAIGTAIRQVKADYPAFLGALGNGTAVRTGLDGVIASFLEQRHLSEAILAVVTIGLLAVALVVIGLLAALIADRRRAATVLHRGRGASAWQVIGAQLVEGLLLSVPPAALGVWLATLLIPARPTAASILAAGLVAGATMLLMVVAALPVARRTLGQLERNELSVTRISQRRLIFEAFVVVVALVGIFLLRRRGLAAAGAGRDVSAGFDPFLAAVPVLLGLAVGLMVLRLYPIPLRFAAWLASLGRGLVVVFALRRVGRESGAIHLPLLVLLLTIGVGVFSSVILNSIERGQVATAWQQVGAPYRVQAAVFSRLPADLDVTAIPGIEAAARAFYLPDVTFDMEGTTSGSTILDAVETESLGEVTRGTPADPQLPLALLAAPPAKGLIGTEEAPVLAIVSKRAPLGSHLMAQGDRFQLLIQGAWTSFEVAEARDTMPGIPPGSSFVVVSFDQLQATRPSRPLDVTNLFVRAEPSAEAALRATLVTGPSPAHLTSQASVLEALHAAPLIAAVGRAFNLGLLVAALYAGLAVVAALILTFAARARDLTFLRTLGLSGRQSLGLTIVEHLPSVVLAVAAGIGLGIGLAVLLEPGLDLAAFAGRSIPVKLSVDWLAIGVLALALATVVAVAVLATAVVGRRLSVTSALRLGDD
jgi:putative ABC transport system permease protein